MPSTLRVSVLAGGAVHDVAVGAGAVPEQVLAALALPPAALRTIDGELLRDGSPLGEQGVRSGTRLLVDAGSLPTSPAEPSVRPESVEAPTASAAAGVRTGIAALGAMLLAAAAALIAGLPTDRRAPLALALAGLAVLVGVASLTRSARWTRAAVLPALPLIGGAAVAAGIGGPAAGQPLLAATASMVTVAGAASLLRADGRAAPGSLAETALVLELVGGAVLAAASGVALLADSAPRALALLLAAATLPVLRLLPATIVRVPDEALLDVRDAAVTAWSLTRGAAGTSGVSADEVRRRTLRHRSLLDGAVVMVVGVGVTCLGVGLFGSRGSVADGTVGTVEQVGAGLVALALVGGLALLAREVRGLLAKLAMLAGSVVGLAMSGAWLLSFGPAVRVATASGAVLVGAVLVLLAVAWGRSWRSLRLARIGDLAESAAVALAVPAAFVAIGVVDFVRSLVS